MSLAAPKEAQIKFARQVAWERGQRLERVPSTSSALSGLIQWLLDNHEPLAATEEQLDRIATLTVRAEEVLDDFRPRAEEITNRTEANKELYRLRRALSAVEYRSAMANPEEFLGSSDAPAAESTPDSGSIPF